MKIVIIFKIRKLKILKIYKRKIVKIISKILQHYKKARILILRKNLKQIQQIYKKKLIIQIKIITIMIIFLDNLVIL